MPLASSKTSTAKWRRAVQDNLDSLDSRTDTLEVAYGGLAQAPQYTQDGEYALGTNTIPDDNSIPTNTEGDEYMTCSITPTDSANLLKIEVVFNGANTGGDTLTVALFQDSTTNALASAADRETGALLQNISFTHWMVSGTAVSTTFKVRAGANTAGNTYFNGLSAARVHGGVMASSITVTEYVV